MFKRLFSLKLALAALFVSVGVSLAPAPAHAGCINGAYGRYLVCVYYINGDWVTYVGPMLDL